MIIFGAVEGVIDEAVLHRLILHVGAQPGPIYGKMGKPKLRQQINGYNQAALRTPWVVLVDLDQEEDCPPSLKDTWLSQPVPYLCFRVAVREIEAWLMADREHLAKFLSISQSLIPHHPEKLMDPKQQLVELSKRSRKRAIREDMVPTPTGGRKIGPGYTACLIEFIHNTSLGWRPDIAAIRSESLSRCIKCIQTLDEKSKGNLRR